MADDFYAAMGRRIRERRKVLGLTQETLAERTKAIGVSYMARIEAGRRKPTLDVLRAVADALGVEPAELIVDETGDESLRAEERRLLAAARKLDARDVALLTTLVERWAIGGKSRKGRR